jgi:hypothetical protein
MEQHKTILRTFIDSIGINNHTIMIVEVVMIKINSSIDSSPTSLALIVSAMMLTCSVVL